VKLLLDENVSRRLVPALNEKYPGSTHVELVGLAGATDLAICDYASLHDFVVVTKDEDFDRLVALRAFNPKLVRLVLGNSSNDQIAETLLSVAEKIFVQLQRPEVGIVEVG
jgi:predicted nuclease of predicted toxin-antitoxin system